MYSGIIQGTFPVEHTGETLEGASAMYLKLHKEHCDFEYADYESTEGYAVHFCPYELREWAMAVTPDNYQAVIDMLGDVDEYIKKV